MNLKEDDYHEIVSAIAPIIERKNARIAELESLVGILMSDLAAEKLAKEEARHGGVHSHNGEAISLEHLAERCIAQAKRIKELEAEAELVYDDLSALNVKLHRYMGDKVRLEEKLRKMSEDYSDFKANVSNALGLVTDNEGEMVGAIGARGSLLAEARRQLAGQSKPDQEE